MITSNGVRSWPRVVHPIFDFMAQQHKWKCGEWCCYGEYIHRDDVCRCGWIRRMAVNDEGLEVVDFYEKEHDIIRSTPVCIPPPENIESELFCYVDPSDNSKEGRRRKYNNLLYLIGETDIYY